MISKEVTTLPLGDLCIKITDGSHYSPKDVGVGYPMLSVKDMTNFGFDYSACKRISKEEYIKLLENDCVPLVNDILVAKDGSYMKHVFVTRTFKEEAILSSIAIIRPNVNIIDPLYLKYYFLNPLMISQIKENYVSGSAVPRIVLKDFKKIPVCFPKLVTQKAIANILSSLDDKIELNNKINNNLEELAQTLYRRWFVDFEFPNGDGEPYKSSGGEMVESEFGLIPKGWSVDTIGNLIDCIKEATKPGSHLKGRKYVPIDTLQRKKLALSDYKSFSEANSSLILFEKLDILVGAMRVYFHKVNLSFYPGITRTTTFVLRSKNAFEVPFNLLTLNQDSAIDYANGTSKGSTMPYAVWQNAFDKYKVINPTLDVKKKFYDLIMPNLELINTFNRQSAKLKKLRDELLPKLMNGEIKIPIEE